MHRNAIIEFSIAGKIAANPPHPSPIRSSIHRSATFKANLRNGRNPFRSMIFRHRSIRMKNCFRPVVFGCGTLCRIQIELRIRALGRQCPGWLVMVDDCQRHNHCPCP